MHADASYFNLFGLEITSQRFAVCFSYYMKIITYCSYLAALHLLATIFLIMRLFKMEAFS